LLLASYFFYGSWDWRFLGLILISTIVDYAAGARIFRTENPLHKRYWLTFSLVTNLGLLAVFKYYNFFIGPAARFIELLGFQANLSSLEFILPVGISFYTFQSLSYSLDIYAGRLEPTESALDFSLFVAFFPQLVAGPIVRAREFLPQLKSLKLFEHVDARGHILLFLSGFFKKAVVADNIAIFSDQLFKAPGEYTAAATFLGVISYAIQIYCDFSGYSDMAIACAGLLGYRLPINFKFPYFSPDIGVFWKRWHISLSTWFMDYLFLPGAYAISRKIPNAKKWHIKAETWAYGGGILLTMLLCGLWHGAAWSFVIWGGFHGAGLVIQRVWSRLVKKQRTVKKVMKVIGIPLTFYFVSAGWIIFRATDSATAFTLLKTFVSFEGAGAREFPIYLLFFIILLFTAHLAASRAPFEKIVSKLPVYLFSFICGILFYFCNFFSQYAYKPFIYFQF
jgi:alginate O-acetyltransferase complex protein AlgI